MSQIENAMAAARRHYMITLSGHPHIALDLLNVLVIDDTGADWLHGLRAKTIVSLS